MALSPRHMDVLIDILENKLSDMLVWDGEDRREIALLTGCLKELNTMKGDNGNVLPFDGRQQPDDAVARRLAVVFRV